MNNFCYLLIIAINDLLLHKVFLYSFPFLMCVLAQKSLAYNTKGLAAFNMLLLAQLTPSM